MGLSVAVQKLLFAVCTLSLLLSLANGSLVHKSACHCWVMTSLGYILRPSEHRSVPGVQQCPDEYVQDGQCPFAAAVTICATSARGSMERIFRLRHMVPLADNRLPGGGSVYCVQQHVRGLQAKGNTKLSRPQQRAANVQLCCGVCDCEARVRGISVARRKSR